YDAVAALGCRSVPGPLRSEGKNRICSKISQRAVWRECSCGENGKLSNRLTVWLIEPVHARRLPRSWHCLVWLSRPLIQPTIPATSRSEPRTPPARLSRPHLSPAEAAWGGWQTVG